MAQWNIRFNGVVFGTFSDNEANAVSKALEKCNKTGQGLPLKGKAVPGGGNVSVYWTRGCPISFEEV